ncbi:MAG: glyoxalase/bleomycin resistance/extradiol dioxygenase family protein [Cyanobacteria bacterium PR.3.49]|nr:glyoxalase/bleomycin resistance/extradiol dioxygenase family protein [Cyanobacteria bacterium PR.3.49]
MEIKQSIPVFRIFDEAKAREFYLDYLGFHVDWEDKPEDTPVYMQISRGGLILHLSEHFGDCCPGARVFVGMERLAVQVYHAELSAKDYKYQKPGLETLPWSELAFDVTDPFGNRISFNAMKD